MNTARRHRRGAALAAALLAAAIGVAATSARPAQAAPGDFTVAPTSLSFPDTFVGDSTSIGVTVTNVSSTTQTPNFAGGTPNDPTNFGGSQNCAGVPIAAGSSCEFTYTFEPASAGPHSSSTTIGIDGENFSISMSGTAIFPITVAPTDLAFPDTAVGQMSSMDGRDHERQPGLADAGVSRRAHRPTPPTSAGARTVPACRSPRRQLPVHVHVRAGGAAGDLSTTTTIDVDGEAFAISLSGNGVDPSATTTTTSSTPTTTSPTTPVRRRRRRPRRRSTSPSPGSSSPATTTPFVPSGSGLGRPPALGHAEVVAQGIVTFSDVEFRWDAQHLDDNSWPYTYSDSPPMFFVANGPGAVLVSGATAPSALLEPGEATFVPSGSAGSVAPLPLDVSAEADRITFVAGAGPSSFAPGAGSRDVNVVRDVLAPGETFSIVSPIPILVIVDAGELTDATGTVFLAGTTTTLSGSVELRNDGVEVATVVAAVVGDQVA